MQPIGPDVTADDLEASLSTFGPVSECRIVTDHRGVTKAFGFARMDTEEGLEAALAAANGFPVGTSLKPAFAQPFVQRGPRPANRSATTDRHYPNSSSVYVSNLPNTVQSDMDLADMFATFGRIASTALKQVCFAIQALCPVNCLRV